MRHRRRTLRATVLLHCVAALLITPLTSAAATPCPHSGGPRDPVGLITPAAVAGVIHQEPSGAGESGGLSALAHKDSTGTQASVRWHAAEKSAGSEGTSRTSLTSRSAGPDGRRSSAPHDRRQSSAPHDKGDDQGQAAEDDKATEGQEHYGRHGEPGTRPSGSPSTKSSDSEQQHVRQAAEHSAADSRPESTRRTQRRSGSDLPHPSPSPVRHEHSRAPSSGNPVAPAPTGSTDNAEDADAAGEGDSPPPDELDEGPGRADAVFGTHDLYEPELRESDSRARSGGAPAEAATGVSPVLPLGAGLTSIGLGLALLAVRLRRS